MRNDLALQGKAGVGIIDPTNNNFKELYQNPGSRLQKTLSKLNDWGNYKDDTIRISLIGDSIAAKWNASPYNLTAIMTELFPDKNIEYLTNTVGGTGSDYKMASVNEIINWNPDFIILGEWEAPIYQRELLEAIISEIKKKSSSEIVLYPFTMNEDAITYLYNHDYTNYLTTETHLRRTWFYSIASKYNLQMMDWYLPWIEAIIANEEDASTLLIDTTHPSDHGISYWPDIFKLHINRLWENTVLFNNPTDQQVTKYYAHALTLPDITDIVSNGTWTYTDISIDKSAIVLQSSEVNADVVCEITGIGFELAYYGGSIGQFGILIDEVTPSTLLKSYATSAHNDIIGVHKVIINNEILSNDELEREFSVTMTSATAYTLVDETNSNTIGNGVITNDEVFTVTGGQLTIPANYAGVNNWRGTIESGQVYTFSVKKNWYDTIDIAADSLTTVTRVFGLERGEHTVKLTVNSGTVNLDSIMELK